MVFNHYESVSAIQELVAKNWKADDFIKAGKVYHNEKGDREYSTPESAEWWNIMEVTIYGFLGLLLLSLLWFL